MKVDRLMYCYGRIPAHVKLCTSLVMTSLEIIDVYIMIMLTSGLPNSGLQTPVNLTKYVFAAGTDDTGMKHAAHGPSVKLQQVNKAPAIIVPCLQSTNPYNRHRHPWTPRQTTSAWRC